jgi:hypothetical protein
MHLRACHLRIWGDGHTPSLTRILLPVADYSLYCAFHFVLSCANRNLVTDKKQVKEIYKCRVSKPNRGLCDQFPESSLFLKLAEIGLFPGRREYCEYFGCTTKTKSLAFV